MKKRQNLFWSALALVCGSFVLCGCEDTDIPTTPPEPFANTNVEFLNGVATGLGRVPGANVNFSVDLVYTLQPADNPTTHTVVINFDFDLADQNDKFVREIGGLVDGSVSLNVNSTKITKALSVKLPADLSGASRVRLFATIVNSGKELTSDDVYWNF